MSGWLRICSSSPLVERAGLAEHGLADPELADVVEQRRLGESDRKVGVPTARERELLGEAGNALRMAFGAGVFGVELARERAQPAEAAVVFDLELGVLAVELGAVSEGGVAAGGLRMDEGDLREREQLVGAADVVEVADAGRGGDLADPLDRGGRERAAGTLGRDPSVQAFGLGEDPAEVVGGEAGDELAVAHGGGEPPADLREHPVAGEAPVLGVDRLEAVDVDEHERKGALVALRAA